jgi:hypothetical protein
VTLYERLETLSSETETSTTTRRRVLERAGKAALGFAVVLAGASRAEKAGAMRPDPMVGCCSLAFTAECPNCTGHGYDCGAGCTRWAWYCLDTFRRVWLCGECYAAGSCGPGCSCGKVSIVTSTCPPGLRC